MIAGDCSDSTITEFLQSNKHLVKVYEEYSYSTSIDSTAPDTVEALIALRSPECHTADFPALNNYDRLISVPHN